MVRANNKLKNKKTEQTPLVMPLTDQQPPDWPSASISKLRWRIVPLMGTFWMLSISYRCNIALAELTMGADLGLTGTEFGSASGAVRSTDSIHPTF